MSDAAKAAEAAAVGATAAAGAAAEAAAEAEQQTEATAAESTQAAAVAVATAHDAAALANATAAAAEVDAAERSARMLAENEQRWTKFQSRISSLEAGQQAMAALVPTFEERLSSIQTLLEERKQTTTVVTENPQTDEAQIVTVQSGEEDRQEAETQAEAAERARHRFL